MTSVFPFSQQVVDIIAGGNFMVVYAAQLAFKTGTVYAHTGTGQLILDGQPYDGVGSFGEVGSSQETEESGSSLSVSLTLSGIDSSVMAETNLNGCRGRPGKLMFVVVAEDGRYAAATLLSGRMDAAQMSFGGNADTNSITVTIVDRMAEWDRTGTERWTDENHRARHGDDDRFFYAVAQLASWPIYWGAKKDAPAFTYE